MRGCTAFSRLARTTKGRRLRRSSSTTASHELVSIERNDGVAVLAMNRPPANSLSLEMLRALSGTLREAESDPNTHAVVLCSQNPNIFCSGLDLNELHRPDPAALETLWRAFQQVHLDLMETRLATLAAMGGHAPAGGCILALACDHRIFREGAGRIGLNGSALGVTVTPWIARRYTDTLGHRSAELALYRGTLFDCEQALRNGLVDELVSDEDDVVARAVRRAQEWNRILPAARIGVKTLLRGPQARELRHNRDADAEAFCASILRDDVQHAIGSYLERLSKRTT